MNSILKNNRLIFIILASLVLIDRIALFINFNFKFVGSDDLIFWQAATDYMHGVFHEPYFYGQNYNFMLEALLAIPFIGIGIPYYYAFPVLTSALALFPFFLFAILLFRKGYAIESFFFLLIPLLLPIEYGILTSITRGFISGLFFTGFFIFCLLNPTKKSSLLIWGISILFGYLLNPNFLVFAFPVGVYLSLKNYKSLLFYIINALAISLALLIQYYAKQFYVLHPDYNVSGIWGLYFDFSFLLKNLNHLDQFYCFITPLFWFSGPMVLISILVFGIFAWKMEWEKGLSILLGIVFMIISLGVRKVSDDLGTIFLSSARMYLGAPLLLALAFFWGKNKIKISDNTWKFVFLVMSISIFFVKLGYYLPVIKYHTHTENYGALAIKKVNDLKSDCSQLADAAKKYNVDLIVFVTSGKYNTPSLEFYDYGCPLIEKQFTKTLLSVGEKRTWVYLKEKDEINKNILVFGDDVDTLNIPETIKYKMISKNPRMLLIMDNTLKTERLLGSISVYMLRNGYCQIPKTESGPKYFIAFNGRYVCADGQRNNLVVANRGEAKQWETFTLITFGVNKCSIRAYNNQYLTAELGDKKEVTARRNDASLWETFLLVKLDTNHVAFKAANGKYLSVDEKSLQLFATGDSIGAHEKFEVLNK